MKSFKINKITYVAKEFDYNTVCDLEDRGISITEMAKKPTSGARAYFSLCSGLTVEDAGNEIGEHLMNGGTLDELSKVMVDMLNDSDFFRRLNQNEEEKATTNQSKKK